MNGPPDRPGVSVVVPVYNSEGSVGELVERIHAALAGRALESILVDDGSRDRSWAVIEDLARRYSDVRGVQLMRNFGQHNATLAGIRLATQEVIVTIDDDLQSPPEEIPKLLEALEAGADVVYGVAEEPRHDLWRRAGSWAIKRALQLAMRVPGVNQTSSFRAFRTALRRGFDHYDGPYVSIDVLLSWTTRRFSAVSVDHLPRQAGRSQYTFRKLVGHAATMVTGFTAWPLRLASSVGFFLTLFGIGLLTYVLGRYLVSGGHVVAGFSFLASVVVIFAGAQLFALGIIGEYLARIHFRSMGRPQSVVRTSTAAVREAVEA